MGRRDAAASTWIVTAADWAPAGGAPPPSRQIAMAVDTARSMGTAYITRNFFAVDPIMRRAETEPTSPLGRLLPAAVPLPRHQPRREPPGHLPLGLGPLRLPRRNRLLLPRLRPP